VKLEPIWVVGAYEAQDLGPRAWPMGAPLGDTKANGEERSAAKSTLPLGIVYYLLPYEETITGPDPGDTQDGSATGTGPTDRKACWW
jgi:hypothetical protein